MLHRLNAYTHLFFISLLLMITTPIIAGGFLDNLKAETGNEQQFLPVDKAFIFSANVNDNKQATLTWDITPGYYLYREHLTIKATGATLGNINIPLGIKKSDPSIGDYHVFEDELSLVVPVITINDHQAALEVSYQGCSAQGYCYPPINTTVSLIGVNSSLSHLTPNNWQDSQHVLANKSLWLILVSFFGFGILLTFTPCVLPMVPILASIIAGQNKKPNTRQGFFLASIYVLCSALMYAGAGVLAAQLGVHLSASLQLPWVLIAFSTVLILLSLSLFGCFYLQLPTRWQSALHHIQLRLQNKGWISAALLGALSVLIVSPCITPPLVGVLTYISQTGNSALGGLALFSMGLGMGAPLIVLATLGVKWLPKSGQWMEKIKQLLGVLLVALALWMVNTLLPATIYHGLWGLLLIISSISFGVLEPQLPGWPRFLKAIGVVILLTGCLIFAKGIWQDTTDTSPSVASSATTLRIKTPADLMNILSKARTEQKPVMASFTAKWCIACQIMKKTTFQDPTVRTLLDDFIVVEADVTANDMDDKALQQNLHVFAPPTQVFFNRQGVRLESLQLVGETNASDFAAHLRLVKQGEDHEATAPTTPSVSH